MSAMWCLLPDFNVTTDDPPRSALARSFYTSPKPKTVIGTRGSGIASKIKLPPQTIIGERSHADNPVTPGTEVKLVETIDLSFDFHDDGIGGLLCDSPGSHFKVDMLLFIRIVPVLGLHESGAVGFINAKKRRTGTLVIAAINQPSSRSPAWARYMITLVTGVPVQQKDLLSTFRSGEMLSNKAVNI
jgi:hypothetical protein